MSYLVRNRAGAVLDIALYEQIGTCHVTCTGCGWTGSGDFPTAYARARDHAAVCGVPSLS